MMPFLQDDKHVLNRTFWRMVTSMRKGGHGGKNVISQTYIRDLNCKLTILYQNLVDGYTVFIFVFLIYGMYL